MTLDIHESKNGLEGEYMKNGAKSRYMPLSSYREKELKDVKYSQP
jgi:hypothetical protein